MNKHTPGPWETATSLSGKLFVAIGHKIGMARKQVCEVLPDIDTGNYEANARLIAAAPELLEALKFITEQIDNEQNGEHKLSAYRLGLGMDYAREAIAKALGK